MRTENEKVEDRAERGEEQQKDDYLLPGSFELL
jgi:hypothetical protein